ncbi:MAG: ABC transporter ATP-binding protein [Firmicutes bacterium]|nr:ABC transporter ATP-binding protein [Bacillota bacterium]
MILVDRVTKVFESRAGARRVLALDGISLAVPPGQFLCVVGPSGCGKSTLLRILAGLEHQSSGTVRVFAGGNGRTANTMVFQEQSVFPWMTVLDNVAYGLMTRGVPKAQRERAAREFIARMGLSRFAGAYPHQLSGGMKQRVSVARAFVTDPEILLMDEPFGLLDEQNRLLLQEELLRIWEGTSKTVVFVTHSVDEAISLGDRLVVMTAQPGKIKADLDVDLPRPRELAALRGSRRFAELFAYVWGLLKEEVTRGDGAAGPPPAGAARSSTSLEPSPS